MGSLHSVSFERQKPQFLYSLKLDRYWMLLTVALKLVLMALMRAMACSALPWIW
jgi:hypothetical protein